MRFKQAFLMLFCSLSMSKLVVAQESQHDPLLTFLSHRSGNSFIYKSDLAGSNPVPIFGGPITDVPSFDDSYTMYRQPHWTRQSPDGKYFASWVYEMGIPTSAYRGRSRPMLVVGDIAGSWTRIVNPDCQEMFAWSPDSRQIAFSIHSTDHYGGSLQKRPETTEICFSGIDGSNYEFVLEQPGNWYLMDWSVDGTKLLLLRHDLGEFLKDVETIQQELFEFRLSEALESRQKTRQSGMRNEWAAESAPTFLTPIDLNNRDLLPSDARYSPTKNEIAVLVVDRHKMFAPNLLEKSEWQMQRMMRLLGKIYVHDLESKQSQLAADFDDGIRGPICWSPDGSAVYFSSYLPAEDDREKFKEEKHHGLAIWAVDRDGKNARFITTGWSPDFPRIGK